MKARIVITFDAESVDVIQATVDDLFDLATPLHSDAQVTADVMVDPQWEPLATVLRRAQSDAPPSQRRCAACVRVIEPGDSSVCLRDEDGKERWYHLAEAPQPVLIAAGMLPPPDDEDEWIEPGDDDDDAESG